MIRKQSHERYKNYQNFISRDEIYIMGGKNALEGISSILDITEEKITKLEDVAIETLGNEIWRENKI